MTDSCLERRHVYAIRTVRVSTLLSHGHESTTELDSHADTCVVGKHALILRDYERPVKVTGYDATQGTSTYKTVDAALAYDSPSDGQPRILVVNQAIHIPQLHHNLLCPMQLRMNDVIVNEVPKFLCRNPGDADHAILVDGDDGETLTIPLTLSGVISQFPSWLPTRQEYDSAEVMYDMTYRSPEWDPNDESFRAREDSMVDHNGCVRDQPCRKRIIVCSVSTLPQCETGDTSVVL